MIPALLFMLAVVMIIGLRLWAGALDAGRIESYLHERRWHLIERKWAPFGRGWFGSEKERLYELTYEDHEGNIHAAICKTSMFSGVYFTEDKIVTERPGAPTAAPVELDPVKLAEENRRHRAEIELLRRQVR